MQIPAFRREFGADERREIAERIDRILVSGMLVQGETCSEFERYWRDYVGAKYAVAVSSGSSALEIILRALDVAGKEVLVPTNTFIATATSVLFAGGRVRFVDTDKQTLGVSLSELRHRRTEETIGVIVTHIGGIITPEIEHIAAWCREEGIWLLEDCAHAHGSEIAGRRAGTFGVAGAYSFFATKVVTACEGGIIVTNDAHVAEMASLLRDHGKPEPWVSYHTHLGSNWRMGELNAAVGLSQLRQLDELISERERIATMYTDALRDIDGVELILPHDRSSWYKYPLLLPLDVPRTALRERMKTAGVNLAGGVYETPLHQQPVFEHLGDAAFPVADDVCARHVCLPMFQGMGGQEAQHVTCTLSQVLKEIVHEMHRDGR